MRAFRSSVPRSIALYVDRKILVINKPPGVVAQATAAANLQDGKNEPENLFGRMLDDVQNSLELQSRPLPVHRLDKSTTGALLLARTSQAAKEFSQQFAAGTVHKTYLALVRGGRKTFAVDNGEIDAKLDIKGGHVSISDKGKKAFTSWEILGSSTSVPLSLLRLTLHTGLKHQLRVHLAEILNAPILGDNLYSRSKISQKIRSAIFFPENRLFLHASSISVLRYRTWGQAKQYRLGVTAPLPKDFIDICIQGGFPLSEHAISGGVTVDGQAAAADLSNIQGRWVGPGPSSSE